MKRYLLIFLAFMGSANLYAQINQNFYNDRMLLQVENEPIKGLTGNPFLHEDFREGLIIAENAEPQPAFLRYDVMDGKMEIKLEEDVGKVYELPRVKDIKYSIDGYTYYLDKQRTTKGELIEGYFIQYYESEKIQFLGWPKMDISRARMAETGYEQDKPAHIEVEMEYYIKMGEKRLEEVRLRPRNFSKFFNDSQVMKKYLSKNKVKDLEDAIKAIEYYDTNVDGEK